MCYYLYGAINRDVDLEDYQNAVKGSRYSFRLGTKHDLKMDILNLSYDYRIMDGVCDCDSPVGAKNPRDEQLRDFALFLNKLRNVKGAKHIHMSKTWTGKRNKKEISLHIDDIDLVDFLANLNPNCLYNIKLDR